MGKPNSSGNTQGPASPPPVEVNNSLSIGSAHITSPQPVDADKDKQLQQEKVHLTRVMLEQAREEFENHQRQYVKTPSERLHTQLLDKERTVKTLESRLRGLTGGEDTTTPSFSQGAQRLHDLDSNAMNAGSNSTWATSLPVSDTGSISDSPRISPCVSPTPFQTDSGQQEAEDTGPTSRTDLATDVGKGPVPDIISIDDEDVNSDDEQADDTGPFSDMRLLDKKPAHMAVFLHYLISNSDPCALFFYIVTDTYKQSTGGSKDLRKWGYEIFSTFLAGPASPLHVEVSKALVGQVGEILSSGGSRGENELALRNMFDGCRADLSSELTDQLADFRSKRDLGLGNIFGTHELQDNMDRSTELKMVEKYLLPHIQRCMEDGSGRALSDRDQAVGWALATFFRQVGITKGSSSGILERVQSFMMKDKRAFKIGSRSTKAKPIRGHQFVLQHFYMFTQCVKCEGLIWGVGFQGYFCQSCEINVHKTCVEDITEVCTGKKRGWRASNLLAGRKSSSTGISPVAEVSGEKESRSPPHATSEGPGSINIQPLRSKEDDVGAESSVRSMVNHYHDLASPSEGDTLDGEARLSVDRKGSIDLNRSESLKGKKDKTERPTRRAKSDASSDDTIRIFNEQSGSSSTSSLSNRSVNSNSSEHVNDMALTIKGKREQDPDLEVDTELPSLKSVLGEDVCNKLKPKEKKRQEVINELFHTEHCHVRNLKVLDILFNQPMLAESGVLPELARLLFPNMDELITLHATMNRAMKERRSQNPTVGEVADTLLSRFDNAEGEMFRKGCAEYCRRQSYALDALKRYRRKDQRLQQFLVDAEADKLCRKLELKDLAPCQMQRMVKYPILIEHLLKHTKTSSQEYKNLERALECIRRIISSVDHSVRVFENDEKLKDMQKRMDKRIIDSSNDPNLQEIKSLDLTQHKLVHDGQLSWRLRSHRLIEVQVVLLEDILVLLQRVDERLVLKCQSTTHQNSGNDNKNTHSPVLKLQNLLARNVATDKKAFFVINTSDTGPQIYEFVAPSQDARKTWCLLINEKAAEAKVRMNAMQKKFGPSSKHTPVTEPVDAPSMGIRTFKSPQSSSSALDEDTIPEEPALGPGDEGVSSSLDVLPASSDSELVQPEEVSVSGPVASLGFPVHSSVEQQLRRKDHVVNEALAEKSKAMSELLNMDHTDFQRLSQHQDMAGSLMARGCEKSQALVAACIETNHRLIKLIMASTNQLAAASVTQQTSPASESGASADAQPSQPGSHNVEKDLTQVTQDEAGQGLNMPVLLSELQSLASSMSTSLSHLMMVVEKKGEEEDTLHSQLQTAQSQLERERAAQLLPPPHSLSSTPQQSRPLSYVSIASSVSEAGETSDFDAPEDDTGSVLKRAQTEELPQDMAQTAEETVQLVPEVQPQVATATVPSSITTTTTLQNDDNIDDSDDGYEMISNNSLPAPENCVATTTTYQQAAEDRVQSSSEGLASLSSEPMTTDLDDALDEIVEVKINEGSEKLENKDSEDTITEEVLDNSPVVAEDSKHRKSDGHDDGEEQQEDDGENNNFDCEDSNLTNPIEI